MFKSALRQQGSFQMPLRQISKASELSRAYQPGDPVAQIDWKAFARTDQLLVREKIRKSSLAAHVIVDTRESMLWPEACETRKELQIASKFELAMRIAIHLCYKLIRQGDQVCLSWFDQESLKKQIVYSLPFRSSSDVLSLYERCKITNFSSQKCLHELGRRQEISSHRGDYMFLCSDLINLDPRIYENSFSKFKVLFHTLSTLELEWDWMSKDEGYHPHPNSQKDFDGKYLLSNKKLKSKLGQWLDDIKSRWSLVNKRSLLIHNHTSVEVYRAFLSECISDWEL